MAHKPFHPLSAIEGTYYMRSRDAVVDCIAERVTSECGRESLMGLDYR